MEPDDRLKVEYRSVKKALEYCVLLNMNKKQSAEFLGIDRATLKARAKRFNITFPDGYATRNTDLLKEVQRERVTKANRLGLMGRQTKKRPCSAANNR